MKYKAGDSGNDTTCLQEEVQNITTTKEETEIKIPGIIKQFVSYPAIVPSDDTNI